MTKYIKDSKGKFAGSIGEGRDNVPVVASELRALADQVEKGMTPGSLHNALTQLVTIDSFRTASVVKNTHVYVTPAQRDELEDLVSSQNIHQVEQRTNGDLVVIHDYEPNRYDNPRVANNNLSRFFGHPDYLPDEDGVLTSEDLDTRIRQVYGEETRMVPIYVTNHSGQSFTTGTPIRPGQRALIGAEHGDRWDTSMVGFAILGEHAVKEVYGDTSDNSWDNATQQVKEEVAIYEQWVNGEMYAVTVVDSFGDVDTRAGFYDIEACLFDSGWTTGERFIPPAEAA